MEVKKMIYCKLFGGIAFRNTLEEEWHSMESVSIRGMGKKHQAFLAYLLLNHHRRISSEELIQNFWPGDNKDPANSLKNTVHKMRSLLRSFFPDIPDLILTQSGGYDFNSNVDIVLDTEQLEQMYQRSKTEEQAVRIELELEVANLYTGDILPGNPAEWLDHLNTYYRNIYIDNCRSLTCLLQETEKWDLVARVCREAYTVAPEVEEFTIGFMHALLATGVPELALRHYETYRQMLWQEYSLVPTEQVENMRALAVEHASNSENFGQELVRQISQLPEEPKAFQCSLMVFRNIVHLELRNMLRNGHISSIAILYTGEQDPNQPPNTNIRRLERVLLSSLRAGDPFTRMNQGCFAVLLPGSNQGNAAKVMERIKSDFYSTYPRSSAKLNYSVYPLSIET